MFYYYENNNKLQRMTTQIVHNKIKKRVRWELTFLVECSLTKPNRNVSLP